MSQLKKILKDPRVMQLYMAVLFTSVIFYLVNQREMMWKILSTTELNFLFYAFVVGILNFLAYGYVSHVLYCRLGAKLSLWQSMQIIFISRIGTYLPGRIWYASNFYLFSRKLNIPKMVISQSFILNNIFLFLTGGVLSIPIILPFMPLLPNWIKPLLILSIFLLFVFFHPKVLKYIISVIPFLKNLLENTAYFKLVSSGFYLKINLYFFLLWFITATKLYFCILSLTLIPLQDFIIILAAGAASLLIGLLAIFAPGGLGVKEGVGIFVLSQIIPVQLALFVMIISRLLQVVTELGLGVVAFYFFKNNRTLITNQENTV